MMKSPATLGATLVAAAALTFAVPAAASNFFSVRIFSENAFGLRHFPCGCAPLNPPPIVSEPPVIKGHTELQGFLEWLIEAALPPRFLKGLEINLRHLLGDLPL